MKIQVFSADGVRVLLSDRPGIGTELDVEAVERYLLPRRAR